MRIKVNIIGTDPIIHHSAAGLDTRSPISLAIKDIQSRKGGNRTIADDIKLAELATQQALWLDDAGVAPQIPARAIRAAIEKGARKRKQGGDVREGLRIAHAGLMQYDTARYGETLDELARTTQFTVPAVIQRARVLITRPKFDPPWSQEFILDCDDELVDERKLADWLDIAGRRVGIGDWRPEKSGDFGCFRAEVTPLGD